MKFVAVAELAHQNNGAGEAEDVAARCAAPTLITASAASDVMHLARRIHAASSRATASFVAVPAAALPAEPGALPEACASLIEAARGGTLLLTEVEGMPAIVQDRLIETLAQLQNARDSSSAVRLMAGTTASLPDCIARGTFSARLFYRLNLIHIVAGPPRRESLRMAPRPT